MEHCAACRRVPRAIDAGRFAGEYAGPLRDIIHAFKYDRRRSLAAPLGQLVAAAGRELIADADCVVPVPLHVWRQTRRGFNQATDLARHLDRPVVNALWRRTSTQPQSGLSAAARRRNVRAVFTSSPLVRRRTRERYLRDRIVVLVDDVKTTGATLDACARVLKEMGAREVRALTVASAPPPGRRGAGSSHFLLP